MVPAPWTTAPHDFLFPLRFQVYVIDTKKDETATIRSAGTPEEIESLIKRHLQRV